MSYVPKNYLIMNNYNFDLIENSLYVYEEEVDYVITIMQNHDIDYEIIE